MKKMAKCVKKESEEYDTVFGSGILFKLPEFYILHALGIQ